MDDSDHTIIYCADPKDVFQVYLDGELVSACVEADEGEEPDYKGYIIRSPGGPKIYGAVSILFNGVSVVSVKPVDQNEEEVN